MSKMGLVTIVLGLVFLVTVITSDNLPTNYEYYTSNGISSGLSDDQSYFTLNGMNITVYSGAMHYFRVPRAYWRDRLKKIRAAGLNTVETYTAWNLHEPESGVYDFGDGGSEMEDFLHLEEFLKIAQEEDLFVIIRSGPYICAEYNFGGFPSWLLREEEMGFRTNEPTYMSYVKRYFDVLMPILAEYQFTKGGPIIAFQVENEYGYVGTGDFEPQVEYLESIRQIILDNGIVELLVTSDSPVANGDKGTIPGVILLTANFGSVPERYFDKLRELQPNKPVMAMEFWIGWFDNWTDRHHSKTTAAVAKDLYERILKYPANVNIYMFHGGTNFGYTNGAGLANGLFDNSGFVSITTSYDYDAPLSEAGDYTQKYYDVKELLEQYNPIKTFTPDPPELIPRVAYPALDIDKQITLNSLLETDVTFSIESETVIAMEKLDMNNLSGQSNGYIVYRKENVDLEANTILKIEGHICDTAIVLVDGVLVSPILESASDLDNFGYWRLEDSTLELNTESKQGATVDIVVEEWGRMSGGLITQFNHTFKGLWQGDVYFNEEPVYNWKIIPLEFKKDWLNNLKDWSERTSSHASLFHASLEITDEPRDTYVDMREWSKGIVFVNGFAIGKYARIGPQQTLYLPAPFLKQGTNDIVIFEHFRAPDQVTFVTDPVWYNI